MKKEFRSFEDAREFVRLLNLKSIGDWKEYCKSGKKPEDIPANAPPTYKKNESWTSWGDFLGTGTIANQNRNYLKFQNARKFVHLLKLKNREQWTKFCKSGNKPEDIPTMPNQVYKNNGWISMGDWLGTGAIAPKNRTYVTFQKARKIVQGFKLKNATEWKTFCNSGSKPDEIPSHPHRIYKKDWQNWGDWLGTGNINTQELSKNFLSFSKAREQIHAKKIKNGRMWREYTKSENFPKEIPKAPDQFYKNKGWKSMGDWLGTGTIAPQLMNYWNFDDAKEFVKNLNLKNRKDWREYCNSGNKSDKLPANPDQVYKNKGWISMGNFLGTGYVQAQQREYRSFDDAKEFVKNLNLKNANQWRQYCKSESKPDDIPNAPNSTYKEWITWGDFLGTGRISNQAKSKNYLSLNEARKIVQKLAKKHNIRTYDGWEKAVKAGLIPENIPANPWATYSKNKRKRK